MLIDRDIPRTSIYTFYNIQNRFFRRYFIRKKRKIAENIIWYATNSQHTQCIIIYHINTI